MELDYNFLTDIVHGSTFLAVFIGLCLVAWRARKPVKELGLMGCTEVLSKDLSALIAFICIVFCFCASLILEEQLIAYLYMVDELTSKLVPAKFSLGTSRLIIYAGKIFTESLLMVMLFFLHKKLKVKPCFMVKYIVCIAYVIIIFHFVRAVDRVVIGSGLTDSLYTPSILMLNLLTVLIMLVYIPAITLKERARMTA
ncbi:hypothetical protein [Thalassomonas sp. RHCl1]|uniref:hypothetical protein n=1 Tax=Thalassomonas sp. RHCl1 TaxID=2995320 RepID=UPI00248CC876|nr:hypothetical protein [Thalassomonas sp. RHCl1]